MESDGQAPEILVSCWIQKTFNSGTQGESVVWTFAGNTWRDDEEIVF
jgi:hypothetical protein